MLQNTIGTNDDKFVRQRKKMISLNRIQLKLHSIGLHVIYHEINKH